MAKSEVKTMLSRGLTPKQEKFCQAYIETGNASEAYRLAYNASKMRANTVNVKATELLKNGKVSVRVNALKQEHLERHKLTVDDLITELEEARQAALMAETPQSSGAVSATMGKAKLLGLDKQVIDLQSGGKPLPTSIYVSFGNEST
ncbi:terminase small subunit [Pelistega sp. MC2]|uniref:terminase small subunit n=1 Tax=Pelistega sp. MC2 TaxID=1720297 RepID=UPI000B18ECD9|nr:terminase small subunit [Pelistega sp. MC2]